MLPSSAPTSPSSSLSELKGLAPISELDLIQLVQQWERGAKMQVSDKLRVKNYFKQNPEEDYAVRLAIRKKNRERLKLLRSEESSRVVNGGGSPAATTTFPKPSFFPDSAEPAPVERAPATGTNAMSELQLMNLIQRWERGERLPKSDKSKAKAYFRRNSDEDYKSRKALRKANKAKLKPMEDADQIDGKPPLVWTPALRLAVAEEKAELKIEPIIYDVRLAIKVMTRGTKWRELVAEEIVTILFFTLILVFVFSDRWLSAGTWTVNAVTRDFTHRPFLVHQTIIDDSSRFNNTTFVPDSSYSDLNASSMQPIKHASVAFFPCGSLPSNCLNYSFVRTFSTIRSIAEYQEWVSNVVSTSLTLTESGTLKLLGAARITQTRLSTCDSSGAYASNNIPSDVAMAECIPLLSNTVENEASLFAAYAGQFQTADQLSQFRNPLNPATLVSMPPSNR